jgi:hypothetical protein
VAGPSSGKDATLNAGPLNLAMTGRRVVAFLSDCHFDPDFTGLFILDGTPSEEPIGV